MQYISNKHKQTNELMVEALKYFFKNRQKELFYYKTQNPKKSATTIDFNLEAQQGYQLFQDVNNIDENDLYVKRERGRESR
jgi:hypothetical protein